jgi:hypothetical protein
MNIDRDLVARAFTKAGEEPITDTEWSDAESSRVRVVKEFYLATLLEALSSYDWTSQKKRARLTPMDNYEYEEVLNPKAADVNKYYEYVYDQYHEKYYYRKAETFTPGTTYFIRIDNNLTGYAYMYPLPMDCANVIAVDDGEPYIVEGGFLFCDKENVVILYVRNYFTGRYIYEQVATPVAQDVDKYYYKDENGDYIKETTFDMSKTYYVIVEEDYNFYSQPQLDPELSAYIECKLAAGIALKLTGGTDKYQMLYNEARLIADGAMKRSAEQAKNKHKGNKWWTDQLGLTNGGEACL